MIVRKPMGVCVCVLQAGWRGVRVLLCRLLLFRPRSQKNIYSFVAARTAAVAALDYYRCETTPSLFLSP